MAEQQRRRVGSYSSPRREVEDWSPSRIGQARWNARRALELWLDRYRKQLGDEAAEIMAQVLQEHVLVTVKPRRATVLEMNPCLVQELARLKKSAG